MDYLGTRNIAMFSTDVDFFDFKAKDATQIVTNRDDQARQAGQGHHPDARPAEAHGEALPTLLRRLKAGGYKVVHMKAKVQLETLAEYDALVKDMKLPAVASRPVSSVVQTVTE